MCLYDNVWLKTKHLLIVTKKTLSLSFADLWCLQIRATTGTGFSDTGFSETGFSDTGFSDTGFLDTGFSDTGFSDTGF